MSLTPRDLNLFLVELVAARHRWEHLVRHADDARVYEQIWDDEHVNAWVICWSEDQDTGFHDHDLSAAAIAVRSRPEDPCRAILAAGTTAPLSSLTRPRSVAV